RPRVLTVAREPPERSVRPFELAWARPCVDVRRRLTRLAARPLSFHGLVLSFIGGSIGARTTVSPSARVTVTAPSSESVTLHGCANNGFTHPSIASNRSPGNAATGRGEG